MGQTLRKRPRITNQDLALLKIKCIRDLIKIHQRKLEYTINEEYILTQKLINSGQREKAKSLVRKKLSLKKYLQNTDEQLENLEALIYRLEISLLDQRVIQGIKLGNETLKKINEIINIKSVGKILLENVEGLRKKAEIDEKIISLNIDEEDIDLESEFQNILNENQQTIIESNVEEDIIYRKDQNKGEVFDGPGPSRPLKTMVKKSPRNKRYKENSLSLNL